jgi:protein disulfide-isomerase
MKWQKHIFDRSFRPELFSDFAINLFGLPITTNPGGPCPSGRRTVNDACPGSVFGWLVGMLTLARPMAATTAFARGPRVTTRARSRAAVHATSAVSRNSGQALSTRSTANTSSSPSSSAFAKPRCGLSLASRRTVRGAVLTTRANSDETDKFQLALSVVNARTVNDDCLALLLSEMSSLSKEVAALKREVEVLKKENAPPGGFGGTSEDDSVLSKQVEFTEDERVMRRMMSALGAAEGDSRKKEPTVPFPDEDFSDVPVAVDSSSWAGDGTDRSHLWPLCKLHDDDIYLMNTMHAAMNEHGFWAGEEDEGDFYFGPSTVDALIYFQASAGLSETGFCDLHTWRGLLGDERFKWGPAPGAVGFDKETNETVAGVLGDDGNFKTDDKTKKKSTPLSAAQQHAKTWSETAVTALTEDENSFATGREDLWGDEKSRNKAAFAKIALDTQNMTDEQRLRYKKWPVLRGEDGGWETHKLQVLLDEQGYYSGEEDMEYWYFGLTTENALGTFQASNGKGLSQLQIPTTVCPHKTDTFPFTSGIPDTGLTCANTWKVLLGDIKFSECNTPRDALETVGDGDFPLDLSNQTRVFLLGEGRFEDGVVRTQ